MTVSNDRARINSRLRQYKSRPLLRSAGDLARVDHRDRPVESIFVKREVERNRRARGSRRDARRDLEAFPVDRRVNSPNNDDPECIQPAVVQSSLGL
jgi:hypothetical protein